MKSNKITLTCNECGKNFNVNPKSSDPRCPKCGSVDWEVKDYLTQLKETHVNR